MTIRRVFTAVFALITLALLSLGCEEVQDQKPEDSFAEGKLPSTLEVLANQWDEMGDAKDIVARVERDEREQKTLKVAVVDCGVDFMHPDLVNRIAFSVKDGKIVGAGRDFMGNDDWASPNLVKPDIYAFGAQSLKDGVITGARDNVVDYINDLNRQFVENIMAKIRADEVLSQSLFQRISLKNFTIFGAYTLRAMEKEKLKELEGFKQKNMRPPR